MVNFSKFEGISQLDLATLFMVHGFNFLVYSGW
jgi:hypothetical protein